MNVVDWLKVGSPSDTPFILNRDFCVENLRKNYIISVVCFAAEHYAGEKRFRFLPMNLMPWQNIINIESDYGKIYLAYDKDRGVMIAGVLMETLEDVSR